jgi:RNA polymerase sigma factor (sigma-70 family)
LARSEFDDFYRTHYNQILRFAERRVDHESARDVCAETFSVAWRKFGLDDLPGLPWMYQTARNLIGTIYRRQAREQSLVFRLTVEARLTPATSMAGELFALLQDLPEKDREALQLTYWEGLSAGEVAEVLGCSEQAAWKRISRAKEKLRVNLVSRASTNGLEEVNA